MKFLVTKTSPSDEDHVRDFGSLEELIEFVVTLPTQASTRGVSYPREVVIRAERPIPAIEIYDAFRE